MAVGSTWKDYDNKYNYGVQVCTSTTRPTAYEGRTIYEIDTDKFMFYNGASWEVLIIRLSASVYITENAGDMELHVGTGKLVKFVVG